ncbi:MAG: rRNA maturation RNase YbeY [bacterium]|nr:rRNA maturation RNase YbeY [bacterium]
MNNFSRTTTEIRYTLTCRAARIPFEKISQEILPQRYVLSLVVCGDKLARRINRAYRVAPRSVAPRYQSGILRSQFALLRQGFAGFSSPSSSRKTPRYTAKEKKKDYSPNVLSFPLGEYEGEIFLNVRKAEREAKAAGISARERVALLFIHGCLHLCGMKHGNMMEAEERRVLKRFGFRM